MSLAVEHPSTAPGLLRQRWRRLRAAAAWAPLMTLGVFLLFAVRAGLPAVTAVTGVLVVALTQVLPGASVWRLVRPARGWWLEDCVAGLAVGSCLAIAAQALAGVLQAPWLSWSPVLVCIVLWAAPTTRRAILGRSSSALPAVWSVAVSAVSLFLLIPTQRFYRTVPLTWPEGFREVYVDVPFHLSIVGELAHRGPLELPHVAGEPLLYHWFSHAWAAQIGTAGALPLDAVLLRFAPPLLAVMLVLAVAITAVRLGGPLWAGPLAGVVAVASGDASLLGRFVPGTSGVLITPAAISLGFSSLLIVVLVALLGIRWGRRAGTASGFVLALLAVGAAGAKGSALAVVIPGVVLVLGVALITRSALRRAVALDAVVLCSCLAGAFALVFRGNAQGIELSPVDAMTSAGTSLQLLGGMQSPGPALVVLSAVLVAMSVLARGAPLYGALLSRRARRDPVLLLLAGAGLAGASAVILLSAAGKSQYYFLRNAIPLLAIGAALGLARLSERLDRGRLQVFGGAAIVALSALTLHAYAFRPVADDAAGLAGVALGRAAVMVGLVLLGSVAILMSLPRPRPPRATVAAVVASCVLLAASVVPTGLRELQTPLPPSNPPISPEDRFGVSSDQIGAARWLRDRSGVEDLVMTNRHCTSPVWATCDSRRFTVAAYTERRVLVEGWAYTASSQANDVPAHHHAYNEFFDPQRLELNDGFLAEPDPEAHRRLWDLGVRWVFLDKTVDNVGDLAGYATLVHDTEWAGVYRLAPGGEG